MTRSRWFRVIVCLLMVCCLVFHMSPIKAEAIALEASLAIGLAACLIAVTGAGIVFVPETTSQIQAIGQSLQTHMMQWGAANNKLAEVQDWFFGIQFYDPGDDGDEDDDDWVSPTNRNIKLARGIIAGISAWCASIILGNIKVENTEETAPDGYMYYGSVLLPEFEHILANGENPRVHIDNAFSSDGVPTYSAYFYSENEGYYYSDGSLVSDKKFYSDWYSANNSGWQHRLNGFGMALNVPLDNVIYINYDVYDTNGNLIIPAMSPSTVPVIEPSIYVGDIPSQIQNGELEPGGIELPDINYDPLIQPGISLQDSTIGTLHKLSTGELSYENFLQQIKVDGSNVDPVDPNPPVDDPAPDDTTDKWEPPSDPGKFAVDLKDFFPFCIPFDLYDFFSCLNADPVAPVIEWQLPLPGGSTYPITLDLSVFDPVAKILRTMELLLFCVGLAFKTRDLIRG